MKLRIEKNSIRFRLRPSDVAEFTRTGRVEASVDFGGGSEFVYALASSGDAHAVQASLQDFRVEVAIPLEEGRHWADSDRVAISAQNGPLTILIEKDFKCMHKDDSANQDAYPNPLVAA